MAGGTGRTQGLYFGVSRIPSEKSGGDPDGPRQKVAGRPLQRVSQAPLLVANPADRECHLKTRSYTRSSSPGAAAPVFGRSEEHTSELQSLMRISYAVFCLKKKKEYTTNIMTTRH